MCPGGNHLRITEIHEILSALNISAGAVEPYRQTDRMTCYLLDKKYLLKISKSTMDEQRKLERVKAVSLTPKVHSSGSFTASGQVYHYVMIDYVQGNELLGAIPNLSDEQQAALGKEIAQFLGELHRITGAAYDIGHYIPTIPGYNGSWRNGHLAYAKELQDRLSAMNAQDTGRKTIGAAFEYIHSNIGALEYQAGAKLLHNDLHPKNIIVEDGRLAGVIDWECSQFGEVDFELAHLFHWCVHPLQHNEGFDALLKSVVESFQAALHVPDLARRLTIYQLEHELNQIVWRGKEQEKERIRRMEGWLNGEIGYLLEKWRIS